MDGSLAPGIPAPEPGATSVASPPDSATPRSLLVGDDAFLRDAEYVREGEDLLLVDGSGRTVDVSGYFQDGSRPDLVSDSGNRMAPEMVDALARVPGGQQIAQAGPGAGSGESEAGQSQAGGAIQVAQAGSGGAAPIGEVTSTLGTVTVRRAAGGESELESGDAIFQNDVIETGSGGAVMITFADETNFSLGANANMAIDEFVYDPAAGVGSLGITMAKGLFRFVSGAVAKTGEDAMTVKTPVATIGIRGTHVVGQAAPDGETNAVTLLRTPGGGIGAISVSNGGGNQTITSPNGTTRLTSFQAAPSATSALSSAELGALYAGVGLGTLLAADGFQITEPQDGTAEPPPVPETEPPPPESRADTRRASQRRNPDLKQVTEETTSGEDLGGDAAAGEDEDDGEEEAEEAGSEERLAEDRRPDDDDDRLIDIIASRLSQTELGGPTDGPDVLYGTAGRDLIDGLGGNDVIFGFGGEDTLLGSGGNDVLYGGDDNDYLLGGAGDDTLIGGDGSDTMVGGAGRDVVSYADSESGVSVDLEGDQISATELALLLELGDGDGDDGDGDGDPEPASVQSIPGPSGGTADGDVLVSFEGAIGSAFDDTLTAGIGGSTLVGGRGDDDLYGRGGNDSLVGGDGDDLLVGDDEEAENGDGDTLVGGAGNDSLYADGGDNRGLGGDGDDTIEFGDGHHWIDGGDGYDTISAGYGTSTVLGGSGDDQIDAGDSFPTNGDGSPASGHEIYGEDGDDRIVMGNGDDTVAGGAGNDSIDLGDGDDLLTFGVIEGGGDDTVADGGGDDRLEIDGVTSFGLIAHRGEIGHDGDGGSDEGDLFITTAVGTVAIAGQFDGEDGIETLDLVSENLGEGLALTIVGGFTGGAGGDLLVASAAGSVLEGLGGDDILMGAVEGDTLQGGAGNDLLRGRGGGDDLDGGAGNDAFIHAAGDGDDLLRDSGGDDAIVIEENQVDLAGFARAGGGYDGEIYVPGDDLLITLADGSELLVEDHFDGGRIETLVETGTGTLFNLSDGLDGTVSNDVLIAGPDPATITGLAGIDVLIGGGEDDLLSGGLGDDVLQGDDGDDFLDGGRGDDLIDGGYGTNTLRIELAHAGDTDRIEGWDEGSNRLELLASGTVEDFGSLYAATTVTDDGTDVTVQIDNGVGVYTMVFAGVGNGTITDLAGLGLDEETIDLIRLEITNGPDVISATQSNDSIDALGGNDTINGNGGNDTLFGNAGGDQVFGDDGDDVLLGSSGADRFDGGDGRDSLDYRHAGSGVAVDLDAGQGLSGIASGDLITDVEVLIGSAHGDVLSAGEVGGVTLQGGAGNDTLSGGAAGTALYGGDGDDDITLSGGGRTHGGDGDDTLIGASGGNDLHGGTGRDDLTSVDGGDRLFGEEGDDSLTGGAAATTLSGGDGNDSITGGGAADQLLGGDGADLLRGGDGNDTLDGGLGADRIDGGRGDDVIGNTQDSDDRIVIDLGHDGDVDRVTGWQAGDSLVVAGFEGGTFADLEALAFVEDDGTDVTITFGTEPDAYRLVIEGIGDGTIDSLAAIGINADAVEIEGDYILITGTPGDDSLTGSAADEILEGFAGNDVLDGAGGADILRGGSGDDTIEGNAGAETIDGGDGFDLVTYSGSLTGVQVDLRTGIGLGGDAEGDRFADIEQVVGSEFGDRLTGGDSSILFAGGAGTDTLIGSRGGDVLSGGADGDRIDGGAGYDLIGGGGGRDTLLGGAGVDTLFGDGGSDRIEGGYGDNLVLWDPSVDGNDTLVGGTAFDEVDIFDSEILIDSAQRNGNDLTIHFTDGSRLVMEDHYAGHQIEMLYFVDDTWVVLPDGVIGSVSDDVMVADDSGQALFAHAGSDLLYGGAGDDTLDGGDFVDVMIGGAGSDVFRSDLADDGTNGTLDLIGDWEIGTDKLELYAGHGIEDYGDLASEATVFEDSGNVVLAIGDPGDAKYIVFLDAATGSIGSLADLGLTAGNVTIIDPDGTAGDDVLDGTAGADSLFGRDGNDTLQGLGGNDTLDAGIGVDSLSGGDGNDLLRGYSGFATFAGGDGNDTLIGGEGLTSMIGGAGADLFDGRGDFAVVDYHQASGPVVVDLGAGTASGGEAAGDMFIAVGGLVGSGFSDSLIGGDDSFLIDGWDGNDTLVGGAGGSSLYGGSGDDLLRTVGDSLSNLDGGEGNDSLVGDSGADAYVFDGLAGGGDDVISDAGGLDLLVLSNLDLDRGEVDRFGDESPHLRLTTPEGSVTFLDAYGDDGLETVLIVDDEDEDIRSFDLVEGPGTDAGDMLVATDTDAVLAGAGGDDLLIGAAGNDTLLGGAGEDFVSGGAGDDLLDGGAGEDIYSVTLAEGGETDRIAGWEVGTDEIVVRVPGAQTLAELEALATIEDVDGDTVVTFTAPGIDHTLVFEGIGGPVASLAELGFTDESVVTVADGALYGTAGNDTLTGGAGPDIIYGFDGDDQIAGGGGDDQLHGGRGHDDLSGLAGDDVLTIVDVDPEDVLDGGDGIDVLDLSVVGAVGDTPTVVLADVAGTSLEIIDLGAGGEADAMILDVAAADVGALTGGDTLIVRGDAEDAIRSDDGWLVRGAEFVDGVTYQLLESETGERLLVEPGIDLSGAIADTMMLAGNSNFVSEIGGPTGQTIGTSLAAAGDFNGDGFADVVIGAPDAGFGADTNAGGAYVLFGSATGLPTDLTALDGSNGFWIGPDLPGVTVEGGGFGTVVEGVGDINNDGFDDIAISAPHATVGADAEAGHVLLLYGTDTPVAGGVFDSANLTADDGVIFFGTGAGEQLGLGLSEALDYTQDGVDDFMISTGIGNVYLVDAADGVPGAATLNIYNPGGLLGGQEGVGPSIAVANGYRADFPSPTLWIGAPGFDRDIDGDFMPDPGDDVGAVVVVNPNIPDVALTGTASGQSFGSVVVSGENVLGNFLDEMLVAAENSDSVYMMTGGVLNQGAPDFAEPNGIDIFRFDFAGPVGANGAALALGDIGQDGRAEILIADSEGDGATSDAGVVHVVAGRDGLAAEIMLGPDDSLTLLGENSGDLAGYAVASVGDVDGDGFGDLLVGAPGRDGGEGSVFLVRGGGDGTSFLGSSGDDYMDATAGFDAVFGFDGDDTLVVGNASDPVRVDGGAGEDTLLFVGDAPLVDAGFIDAVGVDIVDLGADGADGARMLNSLPEGVMTWSDTGRLKVHGDSHDRVDLTGWTLDRQESDDGQSYDVYVDALGEFGAELWVGQDVHAAEDGANPAVYTVDDLTVNLPDGLSAVLLAQDTDWGGFVEFQVAGDVNGDGNTDYLAHNTYLLYGDGVSVPDPALPFTGNGIILGAGPHYSLTGIGDIDGDGFDDVVRYGEPPFSNSDSVEIFFGDAAGTAGSVEVVSSAAVELSGTKAGRLGESVTGIGDFNGDGIDDFMVTAPFAGPGYDPVPDGGFVDDGPGEAYIIFGDAAGFPSNIDVEALDGTNGLTFQSAGTDGYLGVYDAGIGDINGDGFDDVAIGEILADAGGHSDAGSVYVIFGGPDHSSSPLLTVADLDGASGFRIDGDSYGDGVGNVNGIGDVNGDGLDDFSIWTHDGQSNGLQGGGTTFVIFGTTAGFPPTMDTDGLLQTLDGTNGFRFEGHLPGSYVGTISAAGDINGDGIDDMVVGGHDNPGGATSFFNGRSDGILFGRADGFDPVLDVGDIDGENGFWVQASAGLDIDSASVTPVGDVNQDGFDDLLIQQVSSLTIPEPDYGPNALLYGGDYLAQLDAIVGDGADNLLAGTGGDDVIVGGLGHDTLVGGGGVDALQGGSGDDRFSVGDDGFRKIDGGNGNDMLLVDGFDLDLTGVSNLRIESVEAISLEDGSVNGLSLDISDVLDLNADREVRVFGDAGDAVTATGGAWQDQGTETDGDTTFDLYVDTDTGARLLVDQDITNQSVV